MSQEVAVLKMVHDLKSPLMALRILRAKNTHSPEEKALLCSTLRLLEKLLASCVGERETDPTCAAKTFRALIGEVTERHRLLGQRDVRVIWQAGCFRVLASALSLRRILDNLVENALAADQRGPVVIRVRQDMSILTLEVIDEGPGLGLAPAGNGWGVGVQVVRDLVEEAGGSFDFYPGSTRGTRARLRFAICSD